MAVAGKINTSCKKCVFANRILTAVDNSGNSLLQVMESTLECLLMMVQAVNGVFFNEETKRSCSSADEHRISSTASMSKSDNIMENVEVLGASRGEGCSNTLALHILLGLFNI